MASNKFDLDSGVGDITKILHNQGVADLSWLAVDEEDYRAKEALPHQNLDIIPELQKALSSDDDDVPHIIPLKPHTIVNSNPLDTPRVSQVDMTAPIRNRVAHMTIAGVPVNEIRRRIALEFAPGDIHLASTAIDEVLFESGLLGNVYLDSKHFPRCASDKTEQKFAKTFGKKALYILAKDSCTNCVCNKGGFCSSMSKQLVDSVPYGPKLAAVYHQQLAAEKRPITHIGNSEREWKEILRSSFLRTPIASNPDGVQTIQTPQTVAKPQITAADLASFWARRSSAVTESTPSIVYLKFARRMIQGHDDVAVLAGSGVPDLVSLASEYGILGHTYLDMDALGGCRNTLDLIRSRNNEFASSRNGGIGIVPDFILRRASSCNMCKCQPDGACAELDRISTIVRSKPAADKRTFVRSLLRAVGHGRISSSSAKAASTAYSDGANWTLLTAQTNLYKPKEFNVASYEGPSLTLHHGSPSPGHELGKAEMDPDEVRRTLSHLMNTGLSGRHLQESLLKRYSRDDLVQVPEIGRRASIDDGIQGHYFIDPTAYLDYGHGCNEGSGYFRKRGATYLLACDKCTGCRLQTHPGWCSKYAKDMINSVPDDIRKTAASIKTHLPVVKILPVENPVEKYELASEMDIDLGKSRNTGPEITLNSPTF